MEYSSARLYLHHPQQPRRSRTSHVRLRAISTPGLGLAQHVAGTQGLEAAPSRRALVDCSESLSKELEFFSGFWSVAHNQQIVEYRILELAQN
jgi:hypothetical protein